MRHVMKCPERNRITMVVDMQFGSTGKGLIAGYIAKHQRVDAVATAWAANAGHTFISADGRKNVHTMLANGVVSPNLKRIFIGPGSIINPISLSNELAEFYGIDTNVGSVADIKHPRILIHPHAAIIYPHHRNKEEIDPSYTKIGSTKKGVAEAAIERMRRCGEDSNIAANCEALKPFVVSTEEYIAELLQCDHLLIEGAQGYSLSMYHGFYPYTTSRDVSVHQVLADCGVPRAMVEGANNSSKMRIIGTLRTYPIRVANRFNDVGQQIGTSGPCYDDQHEIAWHDLGLEPELTTVTKLPRRIFTFSVDQIRQACTVFAPDEIFVNFINYLKPYEVEPFFMRLNEAIKSSAAPSAGIRYMGFGPSEKDVFDNIRNLDHAAQNAKNILLPQYLTIDKSTHLLNLGV